MQEDEVEVVVVLMDEDEEDGEVEEEMASRSGFNFTLNDYYSPAVSFPIDSPPIRVKRCELHSREG